MQAACPFADDHAVVETAEAAWAGLTEADHLEALAAHPRIGDVESLRAKYAATKSWATGEQSGVAGASDETLQLLAKANADYEAKFRRIFIVCATGKSAAEMLELLQQRIGNPPEEELAIAAAEQIKITLIRLNKLAEGGDNA